MGRKAIDPDLYKLACKLKQPDVFTQYSALKDEAEEIWRSGDLRNVYLMKDGKTFAVKLYVGGAARIIGYSINLADACRFADLARWQFAKYRARDQREPTEPDLNFPLQQVKNDLEHEPKAMALLREIEIYLRSVDILGASGGTQAQERRTTVRHEFNARFAEVEDQFNALAEMIQKQTVQLSRIEAALESFKHHRIIPPRIDTVDVEVIKSERADENKAMMKANPAWREVAPGEIIAAKFDTDTWLKPFDVHIPHPEIPDRIHHTITIQIPVKKMGAEWVLTPEAHAMIDTTKDEAIERLRVEYSPSDLEVTPIGANNPVADIFTIDSQPTQPKP